MMEESSEGVSDCRGIPDSVVGVRGGDIRFKLGGDIDASIQVGLFCCRCRGVMTTLGVCG